MESLKSILIFLILLTGFTPLIVFLGVFAPFLIFFSWPLLTFQFLTKPDLLKPNRLPKPLLGFLLGLGLPLLFAALLSPLRMLTLLAFYFLGFKNQFYFSGSPHAPTFIHAMDILLGFCGFIFGAGGGFLDGFWRLKQWQEIKNLPTSKIRSIAPGLVECVGTAKRFSDAELPLDPLLQLKGTSISKKPFYLEDETGKILIDIKDTHIRGKNVFCFGGRFNQIILTRHGENFDWKGKPENTALLEGDPIYILGYVRKKDENNMGEFILEPKMNMPMRGDFQNIFILTDQSESTAQKMLLHQFYFTLIFALIWSSMAAILFWMGAQFFL